VRALLHGEPQRGKLSKKTKKREFILARRCKRGKEHQSRNPQGEALGKRTARHRNRRRGPIPVNMKKEVELVEEDVRRTWIGKNGIRGRSITRIEGPLSYLQKRGEKSQKRT